MSKSYIGMAWTEGGLSATVWVSADGKVESRSFNLANCKGDVAATPKNLAKLGDLRPAIETAIKESEQKARERLTYADARRRQTENKELEFAFLVTWGRGGHTIHSDMAPDQTARLQGYGLSDAELVEIDRLGIPFIDTRQVSDDIVVAASYRSPLPPSRPNETDAAPWGCISHCPIPVYAAYWATCGATVRNVEPDYSAMDNLRGNTAEFIKGLRQAA